MGKNDKVKISNFYNEVLFTYYLIFNFYFYDMSILFSSMSMCMHSIVHVWRSEDNLMEFGLNSVVSLQESVLTFYHVGPRIELGSPDLVASTFTH